MIIYHIPPFIFIKKINKIDIIKYFNVYMLKNSLYMYTLKKIN